MSEELRELLAELAHSQWAGWMDYLFSMCRETRPTDGEAFLKDCLIIPEWAVVRWKKQAKTPYSELTTPEKDSDRTEADKFLAVFNTRTPDKELVDALEEIVKIRNGPHPYKSIGKCSDMWKVAREALAKWKSKE